MKFFNNYTNIELNNDLIVADIYDLGEENLKYGMYLFTDIFWDKIKENRNKKKAIYLDEIWRLIGVTSNKEVASFIYKIFKTIRKYGGSSVAITQDISDIFSLDSGTYGKSILNNSSIKTFFALEEENINYSKKSHTLAHRQKSLEHKILELTTKSEISTEEVGEVESKLEEIKRDLYKETAVVELTKTEIVEIDDMLKYMQAECIKNKIGFELQIAGNIHYMTNNFISKEDLEILLADHIKDAIIAINHTDNINRGILVRLGEIDGIYSLYIYDSGVEFEIETLKNLGKEPSTTHADEGGTGMGFMNTFDTLRKYQASLTIKEINNPTKDNYTKVLIFKFDKKGEFQITSYRQKKLLERDIQNKIYIK